MGIFTAKQTGVYSLMMSTRSTDPDRAFVKLNVKKPGQTEQPICRARGQIGTKNGICFVLYNLESGDMVFPKGAENDETYAKYTLLQIIFLY